jgi:hypothetical protein
VADAPRRRPRAGVHEAHGRGRLQARGAARARRRQRGGRRRPGDPARGELHPRLVTRCGGTAASR